MNRDDMLPTDLLWQDDGHVTDVVLDTMADGQDAIVPLPARAHVEVCDACARRLGEAVLLTLQAGDALRAAVATATSAQPSAWPIPVPAVLAAVVVAALGTLPALSEVAARAAGFANTMMSLVPNLTRAALVLTRTGEVGPQLGMLSMASVAVLVVCALLIARAVPRHTPLQGGAR